MAEAGRFNGALVRHWRTVRGLSLEDLATAIGSDAPYVSRIERGLSGEPRPATQRRLAKELGVSVLDLQEHGEEQRSDVQAIEAALVRLGWSSEDIRGTMRQILLIEQENKNKKRRK